MADIKSRKPANTAFKQQRLKSWQPLLTPKTVLPTLFVAGIIFAPLGGLFLYESETVNEIIINYTGCDTAGATDQPISSDLFSYKFTSDNSATIRTPTFRKSSSTTFLDGTSGNGDVARCNIRFSIPIQLHPPIFIYYKLENFYQNHRKYVKSLSYNQLSGEIISAAEANAACGPLGSTPDQKIYYPCGLIANSMFNDSFSGLRLLNPANTTNNSTDYIFSDTDISWPSDRDRYKPTKMPIESIVPPPNWVRRYPLYNSTDNLFNPSTDPHFQVWMRTSWYPTFRKLYSHYKEGEPLNSGTYEVQVDLNYDIKAYGGTKSLVITGTSFLGDRNAFMGLAYIIMGCVCAFLGVVFLGWHFFRPRKLGDHDRLSWNQSSNLKQH